MSYYLEAQEIEKPKDISVFAPVKEALTLPLASDQLVENSKWLEAEDDQILFKITNIWTQMHIGIKLRSELFSL